MVVARLNLTPEQEHKLKQMAKASHWSVSNFVTELIKDKINTKSYLGDTHGN